MAPFPLWKCYQILKNICIFICLFHLCKCHHPRKWGLFLSGCKSLNVRISSGSLELLCDLLCLLPASLCSFIQSLMSESRAVRMVLKLIRITVFSIYMMLEHSFCLLELATVLNCHGLKYQMSMFLESILNIEYFR